MQNCIYDNLSFIVLNTQIVICLCSDIDINTLIEEFDDSKLEIKNIDNYLSKNIWNRFYSITITLINLSSGISYNYTIPPEVLQEINDNSRLVISYQCNCYKNFPNFSWFNLWEFIINNKK